MNTEHSQQHRLWVGGLQASVTKQDIESYFSSLARVIDVTLVVPREGATGAKARPFAFITLDSDYALQSILSTPEHKINHFRIDVQRAAAKSRNNSGGGYRAQSAYSYQPRAEEEAKQQQQYAPPQGGYGYNPYGRPQQVGESGYQEPTRVRQHQDEVQQRQQYEAMMAQMYAQNYYQQFYQQQMMAQQQQFQQSPHAALTALDTLKGMMAPAPTGGQYDPASEGFRQALRSVQDYFPSNAANAATE